MKGGGKCLCMHATNVARHATNKLTTAKSHRNSHKNLHGNLVHIRIESLLSFKATYNLLTVTASNINR